jgi:hypothetical protein
MTVPAAAPAERRRAVLRLALGLGQMGGAVASMWLLLDGGVSAWSLGAVVATCVLTTASVYLFGDRSRFGAGGGGGR